MKYLKYELEKIMYYLNISTVDVYYGTISLIKTKEKIKEFIFKMENSQEIDLIEINYLIAPTGKIQEISLDNGWSEEFIEIADTIDKIIKYKK